MKRNLFLLFIVIIELMILIYCINVKNNSSFFYTKAFIDINCQERDLIICNITFNFADPINDLRFTLDYGSGISMVKVNQSLYQKQNSSFFYHSMSSRQNIDALILYYRENDYHNYSNQYLALRNISFQLDGNMYYLNDYVKNIN